MPEAAENNLWDAAIALDRRRRKEEPSGSSLSGGRESSLLVLGSANAGKSTLILRFLERQEASKPTLALEYTYARKSGQAIGKDVCHIWELGGGTLFASLLETPFSASKLESTHVALVVDLSEPHQLWYTLETLMSSLQGHIQQATRSAEGKELNLEERLKALAEKRSDSEHPDKPKVG